MSCLQPPPGPVDFGDADDRWARDFFSRMLDGRLDAGQFEAAVAARWQGGHFIGHAPGCARWLRALALQQSIDAGYGSGTGLGFRSQWLIGEPGRPGVIHIQAPPERLHSPRLQDKNRVPHMHDSGRVSVITQGRAVLHVLRRDGDGRSSTLDCPVQEGDLIFWPAWTPHTFDALDGFWLISAMAAYVAPAADGFVVPLDDAGQLDALPRRTYAQHLKDRADA